MLPFRVYGVAAGFDDGPLRTDHTGRHAEARLKVPLYLKWIEKSRANATLPRLMRGRLWLRIGESSLLLLSLLQPRGDYFAKALRTGQDQEWAWVYRENPECETANGRTLVDFKTILDEVSWDTSFLLDR